MSSETTDTGGRGTPPQAAGAPALDPTAAPLGVLQVFGGGIGFFFRRFGALFLIAGPGLLACVIGAATATALGVGRGGPLAGYGALAFGLGLLGGWCAGGYAQALADLQEGGRIRIGRAILAIARRPAALAAAGSLFAFGAFALLAFLAIVVALMSGGPGGRGPGPAFALIAAPAGPVLIGLLFARFGAVFWTLREGAPLGRALVQARVLSAGRRWSGAAPFALTLVLAIILTPAFVALGLTVLDPLLRPSFRGYELVAVFGIIGAPFALSTMLMAATTVVYGQRLLELRDGVATENLAEIFE